MESTSTRARGSIACQQVPINTFGPYIYLRNPYTGVPYMIVPKDTFTVAVTLSQQIPRDNAEQWVRDMVAYLMHRHPAAMTKLCGYLLRVDMTTLFLTFENRYARDVITDELMVAPTIRPDLFGGVWDGNGESTTGSQN